jgi:hypothetical protein
MSWNHRVLASEHKYVDGTTEMYFEVYEVYYDKDGKPDGYTANPITIGGDSLEGLRWTADRIKEALSKPILWEGDRFPEEYTKVKEL